MFIKINQDIIRVSSIDGYRINKDIEQLIIYVGRGEFTYLYNEHTIEELRKYLRTHGPIKEIV